MNGALISMPTHLIACTLAVCACCTEALADDASPLPSASAHKTPAELAKRVVEITDAVLDHHVDPPTRQQMMLDGIKALYRKAGSPLPDGLSRRISEITNSEQTAAFLARVYPKSVTGKISAAALDESLIEGLLEGVPGEAHLISAKEQKVQEQFAGNRYVGLHIALGMDEQENRPKLHEVFEGGPADRAGVKKDDVLEQIDGVDTKGMPLREAVDRLRGDEGTSVTVKVRSPKAKELRTYKITRGQLPHDTVRGVRKRASGGWDVRLDGPDPIDYLQITEIMASTPHELRKFASQLESDGARALVLDLRGLRTDNLHSTVVIADALLDHGCIGGVKTSHGETKYQAEPGALFQDWPLVVLVDQFDLGHSRVASRRPQGQPPSRSSGHAQRSATGVPGAGVKSTIPVGDGAWSIILTTGRLERGDGRPLALDGVTSRALNLNPSFVAAGDPDAVARAIRRQLTALAVTANGSTLNADTLASKHAVSGETPTTV